MDDVFAHAFERLPEAIEWDEAAEEAAIAAARANEQTGQATAH
jgi:ATP-dependent Lon protease